MVGTIQTHSARSRSISRRVEPVHAHHARPRVQSETGEEERCIMIKRARIEHHAAARHPQQIDQLFQPCAKMRLGMIDDELGPTGRAATGDCLPMLCR
jgi:hypothetical protein